jgi:hypothetical protein
MRKPRPRQGKEWLARCAVYSMTKQVSAARTFHPQLLFPPLTINNFQRHPCHEVVAITVNFGPEKAGVGDSTPSLATELLKISCLPFMFNSLH